jgi:hypothetical protein
MSRIDKEGDDHSDMGELVKVSFVKWALGCILGAKYVYGL